VSVWPAQARRLAATARLVLWSPDGSWHRFPAALLPVAGALARVPAAGVLARLRADPPGGVGTARILAICGPDPAGPDLLPGAAVETRWLAGHLQNVRTVREPAATVVGTRAWQEADVLHLAAHTGLDPWQPWNTAITLGRGEDGTLRAARVADLQLSARLAVLAGCTTAGSRLIGGEGLIGLAGAFLAARTPAVLATLWPVDDAVALRVTTGFYDGLADGLPAAAALDRARRNCHADPVGAAPRHWAAFTLVGDGEVTVPVHRRAPRWPWALLLAGLAVVALWRARR
jgi:CHAT domain-containing protein